MACGASGNHYYRRLEEWFLGAKILDVGCGAKKFPGAVGIDVRCNGLADIQYDLDRLP